MACFLTLFPGCCTEVVCCFCSGEWALSFSSQSTSLPWSSLFNVHFIYLHHTKFTTAYLEYSVFKREKMPSSHELPQHNKLKIIKRPLLEKSMVERASVIKKLYQLIYQNQGEVCINVKAVI